MIDDTTYNELMSIRAMALLLYENADKVLKKEEKERDVSTSRSKKKSGLSEEQKARLIARRKAFIDKQVLKTRI